jgi:hypothetical protein
MHGVAENLGFMVLLVFVEDRFVLVEVPWLFFQQSFFSEHLRASSADSSAVSFLDQAKCPINMLGVNTNLYLPAT